MKVRITQTFSPNRPIIILGNSANSEKLVKMGRAEVTSRKKFQEALVSAKKVRKYRAT